ncbi:L-fucose kinase-like isoform X2 [Clytia hemisphaerica]
MIYLGRLDWSGGWSDTPPISFDQGGKVVTFALSLNNKKPIGCRVKRIPEFKIVLVLGLENPMVIECKEFEDFADYSSPNSPGALLKAAFFCTNILPLDYGNGNISLSEYLANTHHSGFVLQSWSDLPKGSGLGTSSILAGCILSALWKVVGLEHEVTSVLHAVLDLEQMLTTGGGWQDQVGGLCPGIKVATSKNQLPLQVETSSVKTPEGFIEKLEKHLVVVFTGKTRLARNMLQDVLRNWNARSPAIVKTARSLIENANETIQALEEGNLELIGKCLNDCWSNKKKMAHGCEPLVCRQIMDKIKPYVLGISLAGAGGGGFMCMITKQENAASIIKEQIESLKIPGKPTVHAATIDRQGLVVTIDSLSNEERF